MSFILLEIPCVSKFTDSHCALRPKEQEWIKQAIRILSQQIYLLILQAEPRQTCKRRNLGALQPQDPPSSGASPDQGTFPVIGQNLGPQQPKAYVTQPQADALSVLWAPMCKEQSQAGQFWAQIPPETGHAQPTYPSRIPWWPRLRWRWPEGVLSSHPPCSPWIKFPACSVAAQGLAHSRQVFVEWLSERQWKMPALREVSWSFWSPTVSAWSPWTRARSWNPHLASCISLV